MSGSYQGMLALLRELVSSPDLEALLTAALEGALRIIPEAQAGSALLRQGGRYRFVAMRGYSIPLPRYSLSLEDELRWYGASLEEALEARPNIMRVHSELSGLSIQDRRTLHQIYWSLNIPVPLLGKIEAWLSLDRFEDTPFPPRYAASGPGAGLEPGSGFADP